jgi:hypothetical protein
MKEQPPPHAKCKDKFLVCSAEIPVEKESMALTDYVSTNLDNLVFRRTSGTPVETDTMRVPQITNSGTSWKKRTSPKSRNTS